jgi:hypothetical protein
MEYESGKDGTKYYCYGSYSAVTDISGYGDQCSGLFGIGFGYSEYCGD